jgi:hypothetical protein
MQPYNQLAPVGFRHYEIERDVRVNVGEQFDRDEVENDLNDRPQPRFLARSDQIVIDPDLTLGRRIEARRTDAGQLHERDAPRDAHVLLRGRLDGLDPGDAGCDVFEVFGVLVEHEGAAVVAVLVEQGDTLVDLFGTPAADAAAAASERLRQIRGEREDRERLSDLRCMSAASAG